MNKAEPQQQFLSLAISISGAVTRDKLCMLYNVMASGLKIKPKARSLAAILLLTDHSLYECQTTLPLYYYNKSLLVNSMLKQKLGG